mgnify:CR=1 FL=1
MGLHTTTNGIGLAGMRARARRRRHRVGGFAAGKGCPDPCRSPAPAKLAMYRKIRILLADDHPVVRQGFRLIINQEPDMEVVGEASEGAETVRLTQQLRPHVVIMDIAMPHVNGVEATRRITENHPESKVIILSMHKDAVYVRESLRAGAKGYLLKDSIDHDLLRAIPRRGRRQRFPSVPRFPVRCWKTISRWPTLSTSSRRESGKSSRCWRKARWPRKSPPRWTSAVYTVDAHRGRIYEEARPAQFHRNRAFLATRKGLGSMKCRAAVCGFDAQGQL